MFESITWKNFKLRQPAFMLLHTCMMAGIVVLAGSCASANREYQPPRLGAEYRFEDGLRKEKHPQYLFDKKTRKDMRQMGLPAGHSNVATSAAVPSSSFSKTPPVADSVNSVRTDTVFKVRPQ
ncbi:hypothetical protein SAMN05518672_103200 [Chitinophaga sp. CF118]|uniref:hypothetical protein n=1 Tax=Chitinophaga sp. CF118 TaxID=1884367 RepID=UPI0008F016FE|nr:hypothetical protein [Chitinophaga sp. CF118]SFD78324.1 hypothetical protein SAMN05518672_103200 [Chitinophaga sp. CF118]